MYRDADEVESFRVEAPVLAGILRALLEQLSGLLAAMLLLMPPGRPSHCGSIATRVGCRTRSTTSYPTGRKINSRPTG
jgi:hypothetical protein